MKRWPKANLQYVALNIWVDFEQKSLGFHPLRRGRSRGDDGQYP